jgi:heme/copper-type cytochrome/quinol oxidase subunit 2
MAAGPSTAQDATPARREFTIIAANYRFTPDRLDVLQDDVVKLTVRSEDVAYGFTIDAYRLSRRVPAGGSTTIEFHASQTGSFVYYSNLSSDPRHAQTRGQLVVGRR